MVSNLLIHKTLNFQTGGAN